jgi:predicted GIY-YIG superfamily endonuclease
MTDETNVLYRFYSALGELLYIGITNDPWRRFSQHRSQKDWWNEVSTICQQSFATADELKTAEKMAIQSENPRYNKQFANPAQVEVRKSRDDSSQSPLVGKFFHTWRDSNPDDDYFSIVRNGRTVLWQGQIVEQVGAHQFLIQLFSWMDGTESNKQIAVLADMSDWTFYQNNIEMIASLGCSEMFDAPKPEGGVGRTRARCGRRADYMCEFVGATALCSSCAEHYAGSRPILRRNGVFQLGKELCR